ncbi:MAG: DUF2284 domain-containing protein [Oscillospiraceae bacterium]|jgi:predicted metal-binding protein|nr:DUF2284 domain-containing protein [Oscillospiraceae bacterium]
MDIAKLTELAKDAGFTEVGTLDVATLQFLPEVRDMCAADKCHMYNHSWACPPACGTLDEMSARALKYSRGILVQTVAQLEDSFDFEGMGAAAEQHKQAFVKLHEVLREQYPDLFPMGSGGCTICPKCSYPDAPCRFPDRAIPSMEACGLLVSQVVSDNGMKYNHGRDTLAYTAAFLLE